MDEPSGDIVDLVGEPQRSSVGVAVITGGAGGIGYACARRLAVGRPVILADIDRDRLEAAASALGAAAEAVVCDIADPEQIAGLVAAARHRGELDALVHTAAVHPYMGEPSHVFAVNYAAAVRLLEGFLPSAGEGTTVVAISSAGAVRRPLAEVDDLLCADADPDSIWPRLSERLPIADNAGAAYALAKRALNFYVERSARSWGERGARIVGVSPGGVLTEALKSGPVGGPGVLSGASSRRRAAVVDEIASVVAFLCTPEAAYVHGVDIRIDGGAIANINHNFAADEREAWHRQW